MPWCSTPPRSRSRRWWTRWNGSRARGFHCRRAELSTRFVFGLETGGAQGYGGTVAPPSARIPPGGTGLMPERTEKPDRGVGAEDDFGSLFEQSLKSPKPGDVVTGRVVRIGRDAVTVDIGYKSEGQIPVAEFSTREGGITVQEGDQVDVYFESADTESGEIFLSRQKAEQFKVWREIEKAFERDGAVEGTNVGDRVKVVVLKYDPERERVSLGMKQIMPDPWTTVAERFPVGMRAKGKVVSLTDYGAFVEIERGLEGLIHVSEMSWTKRVTHPSKVLETGQEVEVQILDVDTVNRRVSLGLKQPEPNPRELVRINHPVGSRIKGKIKSITDFGLFVEVEENIDGLVHVSDLHWTKKVKHPSELYHKGDEVEAVVLGIDVDNERISLGIKQLTEDPWAQIPRRYPPGTRVKGAVTSITDFGVFVELEEGIEGLIHVSQLSAERVDKPSTLFKPGDAVEAEVTEVDPREKRIKLSIKALLKSEEREEMDAYQRRERESGKAYFADLMSEAQKSKG